MKLKLDASKFSRSLPPDTCIDQNELRCCLDLSVTNGNQTNKSIDFERALMLQTSALEGRPSCSIQPERGALFSARLCRMKIGTARRGGGQAGYSQKALLSLESWAVPLTSFLLLQICAGLFSPLLHKSNTDRDGWCPSSRPGMTVRIPALRGRLSVVVRVYVCV